MSQTSFGGSFIQRYIPYYTEGITQGKIIPNLSLYS